MEVQDTYNAAYIVHFLLGAGNLVPWNSFITAVDYFEYLYSGKHVDKVFSVAYMAASWLVLVTLMCLSSRSKLPGFKVRMNLGLGLFIIALMIAPVKDWISPNRKPEIAYVVLGLALVICGVADGLTMGSLVGATGELPGRYMQAVFAGNASSVISRLGILVCILRIVTKATLPHTPKGLHVSTQIYFMISTLTIILFILCCNLLEMLPIIQFFNRAPQSNCANQAAKNVLKRIRCPAFTMLIIYIVTLSIFLEYLSENVKSRYFRDWYPVLLISTYNVPKFLEKILDATYITKKTNSLTWAGMTRISFYVLFVACVRGPKWFRTELPVVFLTTVLGTTNGYLTNLVPVEELETVGIVMSLFLMTGLAMGSLLGWLWNI
ncbi:LOW QUALITY PROTEIN: hypothetical protein RJ639_017976 [Escallonia herrerae]|uniref:Equilibrative nucleoside transporter n=1 Tax=Escallonia herrerae TaxID=1293975 RepID=A0AA88VAA1_9ASTE|nr:LOW QUALITY PROTEIN: hypothetical protein RJ639_017976 [Escallonia herrerae]